MSMVYDILIRDEYGADGERKGRFYQVGTAFEAKDGEGINCEIPSGLAVSGRFYVRPRKAKAGLAAETERSAGTAYDPAADEIPY